MDDIDRICANLQHFTDDVAAHLEEQLLKEMKRIQSDAKRMAPVKTGQLRNNITADVTRDAATADIVGTVGTNAAHGIYNELGTGPVGEASPKMAPPGVTLKYKKTGWSYEDPKTGKRVWTMGMAARPFLYPALKQNEAQVKENIAKAIKRAQRRASRD